MPRQKLSQASRPPHWLGRFKYWNKAIIAPAAYPPTEIGEYAHQRCAEAFQAHLKGESCGAALCYVEQLLAKVTDSEERAFLTLERYVREDRLWNQDRKAQKVKKSLSAAHGRKIDKLNGDFKQPAFDGSWDKLFHTIAFDQFIFEKIISNYRIGFEHFGKIGDRYKMNTNIVINIYNRYSAQRQYLLGNITSQIVHQGFEESEEQDETPPTIISHPIIPRKKPKPVNCSSLSADDVQDPSALQQESSLPFFDASGQPIDYEELGEDIPDEERDAMVFHWFAHALHNIQRFRQKNSPRPWKEACAKSCLKFRNKLARIDSLSETGH